MPVSINHLVPVGIVLFPNDSIFLCEEAKERVCVVGGLADICSGILSLCKRIRLDNSIFAIGTHGVFHDMVCFRPALWRESAENDN